MLKVGDRVTIVDKEQIFYSSMYKLTTCNGIVAKYGKSVTEVQFNNPARVMIVTKDLRRDVKNQQLEFAFMT